jgi:hypothetical protein
MEYLHEINWRCTDNSRSVGRGFQWSCENCDYKNKMENKRCGECSMNRIEGTLATHPDGYEIWTLTYKDAWGHELWGWNFKRT